MISEESGAESAQVVDIKVKLKKGPTGFGLTIQSREIKNENGPEALVGTFIVDMEEGSPAEKEGSIQIDDQLISVDKMGLENKPYELASRILYAAPKSTKFVVRRGVRVLDARRSAAVAQDTYDQMNLFQQQRYRHIQETFAAQPNVQVTFCAFLSREFKSFNPKTHHVRLHIQDMVNLEHNPVPGVLPMQIKELSEIHGPALEMAMDIAKFHLHTGISYHYRVHNASSGSGVGESEYFPEQTGQLRKISISTEQLLRMETMKQYDGIIIPPPSQKKRFMSMFGGQDRYFESLSNEHLGAVISLLPPLDQMAVLDAVGNPKLRAQDVLVQIKEVREGIEIPFFRVMSTFSPNDVKILWNTIFLSYIESNIPRLEELVESVSIRDPVAENGGRLAMAMTIVNLLMDLDADLAYHKPVVQTICRAMLLRLGHDGHLMDFPHLLLHFMSEETQRRQLSVLHRFMSWLCRHADPSWVFVMPLWHLLGELVSTIPQQKYTFRSKDWWGTCDLEYPIATFQEQCKKMPVQEYFQLLSPLFQVDRRLPQTLASIVGVHRLLRYEHRAASGISFDVYIAGFIDTVLDKGFLPPGEDQIIMELLQHLTSSIIRIERGPTAKQTMDSLIMRCTMTLELLACLKDALRLSSQYDVFLQGIELVMRAVQILDNWAQRNHLLEERHDIEDSPTKEENQITLMLRGATQGLQACIIQWLDKILPQEPGTRTLSPPKFRDKNELQIFSALVSLTLSVDEDMLRIQNAVLQKLKSRIYKFPGMVRIDLYCFLSTSSLHTRVVDVLQSMAQEAITLHGQDVGLEKLALWSPSARNNSRTTDLLSQLMNNVWPSAASHLDILTHILTWTVFSKYIEMIPEGSIRLMDHISIQRVEQGVKLLETMINSVMDASVTCDVLELCIQNKDRLLDLHFLLVQLSSGKQAVKATKNFDLVLQRRLREFEAFEEERQGMKMLKSLLAYLPQVPTDVIELCAHATDRTNALPLSKMIEEPKNYVGESKISPKEIKTPVTVKYFNMPVEFHTIRPLIICAASLTFKDIWKRVAQDAGKENLLSDFVDVVNRVFEPTHNEWCRLAANLVNQKITLEETNHFFDMFRGRPDEMSTELKIMLEGKTLLVDRTLARIEQYHLLRQHQASAEAVLKLKETYELEGDFEAVEALRNVGCSGDSRLKSINEDMVYVCRIMSKITEFRAKCLNVFCNARHIVMWLKQLEGKAQEARMLVNHALDMVQGQSDTEQEKVFSFQAVIEGYGPLIFALYPGMSFNLLVRACEPVWRACERDQDLPNKLLDCCGLVNWLEDMTSSVGTDEGSCVAEVINICSKGTIVVGRLSADLPTEMSQVVLVRAPVLRSKTSDNAEESGVKLKNYDVNELREIQNKAVLVVGKTGNKAEQVDKFVQILDGITRLAFNYMALVTAGSSWFLDCGFKFFCDKDSDVTCSVHIRNTAVALTASSELAVHEHILSLCDFMEGCHEKWEGYINSLRDKYITMNCFTVQQLVFIREIITSLMEQPTQPYDQGIFHLLSIISPAINKIALCDAITVAKMKLKNKSPIERHFRGRAEKTDVTVEQTITTEVMTTIQNSQTSFLGKLENLLIAYQERATTDHTTLVGILLDHLVKQNKRTYGRPFFEYMKPGRPNLIICPEAQMLRVMFALYMLSPGHKLDLPQRDEVLLCNHNTTAEEVELLLRRCSIDKKGRVYSLACADLLDSKVSRQVENALTKLNAAGSDWQLVVLCSQEQENSYIVNVLDQCRVATPPIPTVSEIRHYLKHHFTVQAMPHSGAYVDPDWLCVRLIKSRHSGMGKSLKIKRMRERLRQIMPHARSQANYIKVPLVRQTLEPKDFVSTMADHIVQEGEQPRIIHLDVGHEVLWGVDYLLFNLLVLGSVMGEGGRVWQRSKSDLYLLENWPLVKQTQEHGEMRHFYTHRLMELLPAITCWSPADSRTLMGGNMQVLKGQYPDFAYCEHDQLMDRDLFLSQGWQRPFQYLKYMSKLNANESVEGHNVSPEHARGTEQECIDTLLRHCGIHKPSWAELSHFVNFLNTQMKAYESSCFCQKALVEDIMPGFGKFVLRFMIQMSRDFATRSLELAEEGTAQEQRQDELAQFEMKRRWESSAHPYIFFNNDGATMTFLGFMLSAKGDLVTPGSHKVIERGLVNQALREGLRMNGANINEDFEKLSRNDQLAKLCTVMGVKTEGYSWQKRVSQLDPTYVLTLDNVKKMLAIYMRFRCGIPVVVMGETGCGKTRLVKFMCELQKTPGEDITNMIIMKVHGGTTERDIIRKIEQASAIALSNEKDFPDMDTVLFFDEANTTEAIGLIKEVMCDGTVNGQPLPEKASLKLVAACNPYRKHSSEMIQRLEKAGLGYHVKDTDTTDKLGRIPMRQLVYRVQPLPKSMRPLVWDFGQLNADMETKYIEKMVERFLPDAANKHVVITAILASSQKFMRQQKHECTFVSLRDVERALNITCWFLEHKDPLFQLMDKDGAPPVAPTLVGLGSEDLFRALLLALGVCYYSRLEKRQPYLRHIVPNLTPSCLDDEAVYLIEQQIEICQRVFLTQVELGPNIAPNRALCENFFMMVVCTDMRIPLFLVGKPGSSKSLAKTLVQTAMEGRAARSPLFQRLKAVHVVSFQCSQVSTPEGIVNIFRQCAQWQKTKDLDDEVAVVVLDEVGLAEDSPKMPLKTLHPLLEDGCQGDDTPESYKKVGFVGISNWALDPAKMNRGIFVQRAVPDIQELKDTASKICSSHPLVSQLVEPYFKVAAECYTTLCELAMEEYREYFGLRDYYSLVKMFHSFSKHSGKQPTWYEIQHAVLRNFGGLSGINPMDVFAENLKDIVQENDSERQPSDPDCSPQGLVRASLEGDTLNNESRYLLILTENYAALGWLQQELLPNAIVIYGSSFPKDQQYTQLCRNINTIKLCMEIGRPVILLNLENLYESLYDALNQYYVHRFGQKFVYLALGSQRVLSKVHPSFRLVVVAERSMVLEHFPIPLINRLEKQYLTMATLLTKDQAAVATRLTAWAEDFTKITPAHQFSAGGRGVQPTVEDVFIGYCSDTPASLVIQACATLRLPHHGDDDWAAKVFQLARTFLVQCATPDSVLRLSQTKLAARADKLREQYFTMMKTGSLEVLLQHQLSSTTSNIFIQVTTHSPLLSAGDLKDIVRRLGYMDSNLCVEFLQGFDTEQQFCNCLQEFYQDQNICADDQVLVLQCNSGDHHAQLINCARHFILNTAMSDPKQKKEERRKSTLEESRAKSPDFLKPGTMTDDDSPLLSPPHSPCPSPLPSPTHSSGHSSRTSLTSALPKGKRHLVFIIQLPRVTGGCITGFQGGKWRCFHIDALLPERELEVSILSLRKRTISSLFIESIPEGTGLDVDALLHRCLHQALALIRDPPQWTRRKTDRLNLMLQLLKGDYTIGNASLLTVIQQRLGYLLQDKEETFMNPLLSTNWQQEAVAFSATNKTGNCRRAMRQYLDSKIAPLLSGLVSFMDTNANTSLLGQTKEEGWRSQMWMSLLADSEATPLKYNDVRLVIAGTSVPVHSTGYNGSVFEAKFPFSWLLKDQLDALVKQKQEQTSKTESFNAMDSHLMSLLEVLPIGRAIYSFLRENNIAWETLIPLYMHDFICMSYRANELHLATKLEKEEYKLIKDALVTGYRELAENATAVPSLAGLHLTYHHIQNRLDFFSQLVAGWPEVVKILSDMHMQSNEMLLDFSALEVTLRKYLHPERQRLDMKSGREQWTDLVEHLTPIIDQILQQRPDNVDLGPEATNTLNECRLMWARVGYVKLFISSGCVNNVKMQTTLCTLLWEMMADNPDLKTLSGLEHLEAFLKKSNKLLAKALYGEALSVCQACDEAMKNPTRLPCGHVLCLQCVEDWKAATRRSECPVCNSTFSDNPKNCTLPGKRSEVESHNQYRRSCNTFFMGAISRYCLSGTAIPQTQVIEKLIGYVTRKPKVKGLKQEGSQKQTQSMTVLDDCIDPTPVVRSVLLQMILQSGFSKVDLNSHLNHYFAEVRSVLCDQSQVLELCLLIVYCLEDHYEMNSIHGVGSEEGIRQGRMNSTLTHLHIAGSTMLTPGDTMHKLRAVASARQGLAHTALLMHEFYLKKNTEVISQKQVTHLLALAHELCVPKSHTAHKWPRIFLLRQLSRRFGYESIQSLAKHSQLKWLLPPEAQQSKMDAKPHVFGILGPQYSKLRYAVSTAATDGDVSTIQPTMTAITCQKFTKRALLLAVFREMTCATVESNRTTLMSQQIEEAFIKTVYRDDIEDLLRKLVGNRLSQNCRMLQLGRNSRDLHLLDLYVHWKVVMTTTSMKGLLHPLNMMKTNPPSLKACYLPTMPEDEMVGVRGAMTESAWKCPKGHVYYIGNCGRPYTKGVCPECKSPIGGEAHKEATGNKRAETVSGDQTKKGHCLGTAGTDIDLAAYSLRQLNPTSTAIIRLLMHLCLLDGANTQNMSSLITPRLIHEEIPQFLWNHIIRDLAVLEKALGKSRDDCLIILHIFMEKSAYVNTDWISANALDKKEERAEWEKAFSSAYIAPILKSMDKHLADGHKSMAYNPLLKLLYETESEQKCKDYDNLQTAASLWRYRPRLSAHLVAQELLQQLAAAPEGADGFPVLNLFLKKEHSLRALAYLPNIMRLQRYLLNQFMYNIDREEASKMSIGQFLSTISLEHKKQEINKLLRDFFDAWKMVHNSLDGFAVGHRNISAEMAQMKMTFGSSIAKLLPNQHGHGLAALALMHYLVRTHNDFMNEYASIRKSSLTRVVDVRDVTLTQLVAYDRDRDLMPAVMAHCNYLLAGRTATTTAYDFAGMERHLEDRFIRGRPEVNAQIRLMCYRAEVSSSEAFDRLQHKIPQVALPGSVLSQFESDTSDLMTLNDCLSTIDIAVGYLVSTGGKSSDNLVNFIQKILQMECVVLRQKAVGCQLQHVRALWLHLSHERAGRLYEYGQEPFDHIDATYHEELPKPLLQELQAVLRQLNLPIFLSQLYECIVLQLTIEQDPNDEDFIDNHDQPLGYVLYEYIDGVDGPDISALTDGTFPGDIKVGHCVSTWKAAQDVINGNETQTRSHPTTARQNSTQEQVKIDAENATNQWMQESMHTPTQLLSSPGFFRSDSITGAKSAPTGVQFISGINSCDEIFL